MAAWLRCWQKTRRLRDDWNRPRNQQMEITLRFELLTVPHLGLLWQSGARDFERVHWGGLSPDTMAACGYTDQLGDDWRRDQEASLSDYQEAIMRISAQNFRVRNLTFGLGESLVRSQAEKLRVYRDRRLAAQHIGDHILSAGHDDPLVPLMEFYERREARRTLERRGDPEALAAQRRHMEE